MRTSLLAHQFFGFRDLLAVTELAMATNSSTPVTKHPSQNAVAKRLGRHLFGLDDAMGVGFRVRVIT